MVAMVILRRHAARRGEEVVAFGLPFRARKAWQADTMSKGSNGQQVSHRRSLMTERSLTHVMRNAHPLCGGQAISGALVHLRIEIDSPDDIDRRPAGSTDAGCSGLSRLAAIDAGSAC